MDSMRSLNTSLPSATSARRQPQQTAEQMPPESTFQAFRQAALSVANLYKAAASDHLRAHDEGYNNALEDLLAFLNEQQLGRGHGEGWAVRQWIKDRLKGGTAGQSLTDSDEEAEEKRARSSSPVMQSKPSLETLPAIPPAASLSPIRPESAPPVAPDAREQESPVDIVPLRGDFTFTSTFPYPSVHEVDMDNNTDPTSPSTTPSPPIRSESISRSMRSAARQSRNTRNNNGNNTSRPSIPIGSLGSGAGLKRRLPLTDWFDIGSLGNGKDPFGGNNKRGRLT